METAVPFIEEFEDISSSHNGKILKKVAQLGRPDGETPRFEGNVKIEYALGLEPPTFSNLDTAQFTVGYNQAPSLELEKAICSMTEGEMSFVITKKSYAERKHNKLAPWVDPSSSTDLDSLISHERCQTPDGTSGYDKKYRIHLISVENPPPVAQEDALYWAEERKAKATEMFKRQQWGAAKKAYKAALLLIPDDPFNENEETRKISVPLHLSIATCLLKLANYHKALNYTSAALDMQPDSIRGMELKAKALMGMQQFEQAKQAWNAVLQKDSGSSEAKESVKLCERLSHFQPVWNMLQQLEGLVVQAPTPDTKSSIAETSAKLLALLNQYNTDTMESQMLIFSIVSPTLLDGLKVCSTDATAIQNLLQVLLHTLPTSQNNAAPSTPRTTHTTTHQAAGVCEVLVHVCQQGVANGPIADMVAEIIRKTLEQPQNLNAVRRQSLQGVRPLLETLLDWCLEVPPTNAQRDENIMNSVKYLLSVSLPADITAVSRELMVNVKERTSDASTMKQVESIIAQLPA
eukprot:TRINITY_DN15105_c0_g1_i1.p1 TRINITY_DN15105_c0_g1~~TRINITY_DN15105_c0_g1_i1.p1  ORF type:complete len:520 (+),score=44.93 TRINITY_DN15105_c0_g1_i1:38-1597(+)